MHSKEFSCVRNLRVIDREVNRIVLSVLRGGTIQTLMELDSIVEINETEKLNAPIGAVFKADQEECRLQQLPGEIINSHKRYSRDFFVD